MLTRTEDLVARLRAENDELREEITQLREALGATFRAPPGWRLTGSEEKVLGVLVARPLGTRDAMMAALYLGNGREPASPKTVELFIWKARQKLRPVGILIHNQRGRGWYLDDADRQRLWEGR